jgi:amino-acid N-acetyltransferase
MDAERAFYVDEFAGATIVVALGDASPDAVGELRETSASLRERSHLVVVAAEADAVARALDVELVLDAPPPQPDRSWLAVLWLAIADVGQVVVRPRTDGEAATAADLAVALRALKLVITDAGGGWGRPPRSFADVGTHAVAFEQQLADRQGGAVVAALRTALGGGVTNVNLCRPSDLDRELFTFDGAGTLFTSGGYVELGPLRVDDLPAVERLVAQGVEDGLLKPRDRAEVAALAATGLGARVVGSGHLAGIVSLDVERYRGEHLGEVACLYTVSRFSGAGAGALLVDGLLAEACAAGLHAVFAVTVSEAAGAFFARKGFDEVDPDVVPERKWDGYDPVRRAQARVFWRAVGASSDQVALDF